jgi:molecular chaperone GrpE
VRLARELLPALDSLDRALAAAADADEGLIEGLRLVQRELLGALERVGVEPYGAAGELFDPELHEAVAQQPFDGCAPGEIVEVYQPGYRLAGGVIRPARVLVAG